MTLLERYDDAGVHVSEVTVSRLDHALTEDEIRRALAIAQAVEEWGSELSESRGETLTAKELLLDRADELLKDGK